MPPSADDAQPKPLSDPVPISRIGSDFESHIAPLFVSEFDSGFRSKADEPDGEAEIEAISEPEFASGPLVGTETKAEPADESDSEAIPESGLAFEPSAGLEGNAEPGGESEVEASPLAARSRQAGAGDSASQNPTSSLDRGADIETSGEKTESRKGREEGAPIIESGDSGQLPKVDAEAHRVYLQRLQIWLEGHKRYPKRARRRQQEGTAMLRIVMDRQGRIVIYELIESTGHRLLDKELRSMIERASPLPPIPAGMTGSRLEVRIPIAFSLR
ncbi:MAG: energy transducer TonB [Ectothiorhodospiraceae bacterium AqS1]|nr:energy transducer TonB [Ectothiorhodospiraceae bacterium AqS1]